MFRKGLPEEIEYNIDSLYYLLFSYFDIFRGWERGPCTMSAEIEDNDKYFEMNENLLFYLVQTS